MLSYKEHLPLREDREPKPLEADVEIRVASQSVPGVLYTVARSAGGGWSCDCPAFEFSRKPKCCKHVRWVQGVGPAMPKK